MEVLANATKVNINHGHFSNVGRNQYNNCTFHRPLVWPTEKRIQNLNLPQLSEFTQVKCGDIYKNPNGVCYSWRLCSNGKDGTEAAVYHAELNITGPFGQKKFTVKTYRGRNAMKEWRRDFLRCSDSENWSRDIPLFGYNTSSIPLLIFCGELIPIAHIQPPAGLPVNLMRVYLEVLENTLGCFMSEIWMDPMNGKFCRGPAGPKCWRAVGHFSGITAPANVEFLKEGVLIRYLSSMKYDRSLLWALNHSCRQRRVKDLHSTNYHQVISSVDKSTIASRRNVRWANSEGCLKKSKVTRHGLTRFQLKNDQRHFRLRSANEGYSWLAQASSVFHAHGIRLDEDLSLYKLVYALFDLEGTLKGSKCKHQRRQLSAPIYFFLEPCPSPGRRFYFWSHHQTGRNSLSLDMCKYLGLPFKLPFKMTYNRKTWPTKIYKALHDYQISRGFAPQTTDFAKFMNYPFLEVIPRNRLQELDEDENILSSAPDRLVPELDNALQHLEGAMPSELIDDVCPERRENSETQVKGSDHVHRSKGVKHRPFHPFSTPFTRLHSKVKTKGKELWRRVRA